MTALLEFKQKIKGIYAQYEMYLLPLLKFVLALVYFIWINTNMGYMTALDNIFVVLILSLICCILPSGMMIFAGFALMVGHCYALGIEVAAFLLVLILFMMILFLRFSSGKNIVLVFTPLAFAFDIPVLLPIGCGLLSSAVSALPAAGGVIIYYFVRTVRIQSQALLGMDSDIVGKLTLLSDSLMKNGEMWLTLIAFIVVVLAVNLIRTRMFDYAWRIAIVAGGVIYIVIMLAGALAIDNLPVEQYPNIAPPSVRIKASYPGASAKTVEDSVTQVREQNMTGIDNLLYMSAQSDSSGSVTVTVNFLAGTNPDTAQVQVQNKIMMLAI